MCVSVLVSAIISSSFLRVQLGFVEEIIAFISWVMLGCYFVSTQNSGFYFEIICVSVMFPIYACNNLNCPIYCFNACRPLIRVRRLTCSVGFVGSSDDGFVVG